MLDSGGTPLPDTGGDTGSSKVIFGKYELGRLLGCGASGKVYHALDVNTGASVAIKVIPKHRLAARRGLESSVMREVAIMRRLRHRHVARLLEVLASRARVYFVMEFLAGGDLFARLARAGRLPEDLARRYFRQLVSAVAHCHARGVHHRDLKPENLLFDEDDNLKVSDFGLGALPDTARGADGLLHTLCGTPAYVAPEILVKKGYDGAKVDVWSCGVILFVLSAGYLPFNDFSLANLYRKIYRGQYRCPRWTSPELRRLIGRLLDTNPETRITVEEIVRDPWFRKGLDDGELAAVTKLRYEAEEEEEKFEDEEERELNAFDIISYSSGMDLAGLVGPAADRDRFVSTGSVEEVMERVEEAARAEGLAVRRREGRKGFSGLVVEGHNGNFVARAEARRLSGELAMVEVERGGGKEAVRWSGAFWRDRLAGSGGDATADRLQPVN